MRIIEETRAAWSAPWGRRLAVLALAVVLVAVAAHWLALLETPAFFWSVVTAVGMSVAAILLGAVALPRVWYYGYRGGPDIVKAFVLGTLVLAPAGFAVFLALTTPKLSDVSTDLEEPPLFVEAGQIREPGANALTAPDEAARALQAAEYPEVTGRRYDVPIETVRSAVETTMKERGWHILGPNIIGTGSRFNIETQVYSPVLALPSDVVVRMVEEGDSTFVDMRAAFRYGDRDFGINAELVSSFLKDLDAQVATLTPAAPQE
ncbi:MAG: DUF1499 domain-containing protein [Rhizobiaceae bacterium]|nr:DUF1499 domain-containing protein [Rhizobiaceae bacterium]